MPQLIFPPDLQPPANRRQIMRTTLTTSSPGPTRASHPSYMVLLRARQKYKNCYWGSVKRLCPDCLWKDIPYEYFPNVLFENHRMAAIR